MISQLHSRVSQAAHISNILVKSSLSCSWKAMLKLQLATFNKVSEKPLPAVYPHGCLDHPLWGDLG